MNDIIFMSNNLAKFAQDESPPDIAFTNKLFGPKIRKDPLGTVLIIGYIFLACGDSTTASYSILWSIVQAEVRRK